MIASRTTIAIPGLVKIKSGALEKLGIYCSRCGFGTVAVIAAGDLPAGIIAAARKSLGGGDVWVAQWFDSAEASFEQAQSIFVSLPGNVSAVIGLGGGRALDVAKYVAFLGRLPNIAVPTSLSNDGFCSPGASLTVAGSKRSLPAAIPFGVIIDTDLCLAAPEQLWLSGVGDLAAKLTAVRDWKLAFHAVGEPVNDFSALLSDATVFQFISRPARDQEGARLLGTSLMLNGIAMEVCGSSRPASGSEHLISHALDRISARPRLHGLQVGVAAYIVSRLQGGQTDTIRNLFETSGFWNAVRRDPFSSAEWIEAVRQAPTVKKDFYTVLSSRDCVDEIRVMLESDAALAGCFSD
ncbi:MAG: iron-containing alcohol dehydrogenase family protein [Desulfuromonadaceae bacterium]|nr:iron-containing alcohol dehydrogenase family protein [Desulfuromonadaceae bacterium]